MRTTLVVVCALMMIGPAFGAVEDESPHPADVVWDSPSKNSRGSMPIGNGDDPGKRSRPRLGQSAAKQ